VLVAKGCTASDAYRAAYDCQRSKPNTVQRMASELLKVPAVYTRVADLQERAAKAVVVTLESHLEMLATLRDEAVGIGALAPAVTAEVARGKVVGLYTERHEHKVAILDWPALLGNDPGAGSPGTDDIDGT